MLSKNAETNPSASALCHDAAGSDATGMSEADATRHSRKSDALDRARHDAEVRAAPGAGNGKRERDGEPDEGKPVRELRRPFALMPTLTATALARTNATVATRGQSIGERGRGHPG